MAALRLTGAYCGLDGCSGKCVNLLDGCAATPKATLGCLMAPKGQTRHWFDFLALDS